MNFRFPLPTLAAMALLSVATIQPASALPINASGSFSLAGLGVSTVDTGNIATNTAKKTDPAQLVTFVSGNLTAGINVNDNGSFGNQPIDVPQPPNSVDVNINDFTLTINGIVFTFTTGHSDTITATNVGTGTAGFINSEYHGTITNGNGIFNNGTAITMSETCTQPAARGVAGPITCTNAVITTVPEPTSLALLGAALAGFGVIARRRRRAA